jgi:hypothetical protein
LILSTNRELSEYELIRRPEHVAKVWSEIEKALPNYWDKFVQEQRRQDPIVQLGAKLGKSASAKTKLEAKVLVRVFEAAVTSYETEAQSYRKFFSSDALEEYQDDPNAFKQALSRDVPVICNTLRQRRAELKEWQKHFRMARAKDLLEVFSNVLEFKEGWLAAHPRNLYGALDEPAAFDLDPLDDDETMYLINVIGMGIKSIVLYHLAADRLPSRGRTGLYGLYFLSGRGCFGLPSDSSEFLMVNDRDPASDGSIIMEHNFYYPYGLFSWYALRVFRWIEQRSSNAGLTLDRSVRYVYVDRFFEAVCAQHPDDLKTMRAHERFQVPE